MAVLHVGPSPGVAPLSFTDCAVRRAVAEARLLADAGVSGFLVENTHDAPGVPERMMGPEIAAYLTRIAAAVRREVPRLPLGVIVRPRAGRVAMAVALAVDGAFVAVGGWDRPDRSLVRAAQTVREHAVCLLRALSRPRRLVEELAAIAACIGAGCRIATRKTRPSAFQLWLDPTLGGLT